MSAQILQQVFQLNNEGAALLCSPDVNQTKVAMACFNKALSIASTFPEKPRSSSEERPVPRRNRETGIWDLCLLSTVPIPSFEENNFYFFDQALYLRPEIFVDHMSCNTKTTIEFFAAVTLMNTALAFCRLAHACPDQGQGAKKAEKFLEKSLQLFETVASFLTTLNPVTGMNAKVALFFILAAQNNCSWLCLKLGNHTKGSLVQAQLRSYLERGGAFFPSDSIVFVEEIFLNSTVLAMTNTFSSLPAAAA